MPSSKRKKRAKASAPDPPLQLSPDNRAPLRPEDVCVGCIAWLPSYPAVNKVLKCKKTSEILEESGYDHPVVILSVQQGVKSNITSDLTVRIAMLTSFKSIPLSHYLLNSTSPKYRRCIPIIPPNSETAVALSVLRLEEQTKLRKQSYVRLQHTYKVPISDLRVYDFGHRNRAYQKRLDKESYVILMNALDLSPEPFPPTSSLSEVLAAKPEVLADSEGTHLFRRLAECRQTIHQLPQPQIQLCPTDADALCPEPTLYHGAWSFYHPDVRPAPPSANRGYRVTTSMPLLLPPPIPNQTTRNLREKRPCIKQFVSLILPLGCVFLLVYVFWLLSHLYRSRR